ncbi:MAG TPA: site-specific integrase [Bacteroidia bacterium]|jgi:site-specific recombinase XerD|nr:site-specific integrase [Bacteroidia bacterium]
MKANFTAVYNRKDTLNNKGKAPIEIRMYHNRTRRYISTGIFITPVQWDEKREEINKKHSDAEILNYQIRELITSYEKLQVEHSLKGKPFSINLLSNKKTTHFNGSFVEFVKAEIKNNELIGPKTKLSHSNTLNKLLEFKGKPDIKFEELTYTFVDAFLNWLRKKKLAINTIHKQHKNLKKYIEIAIKKGYYDQANPCKEIKVKSEQKKRDVLTIDEIKKIKDLDLSKYDKNISIVRDMFLFSCFTGLRISDTTNLKTEYVKKGTEGYELDFITIKVNKRAEIPLYSLFKKTKSKRSDPEVILEKYYDKKNDFVFPKLTEPFINRNIKLVTELAKIPIKVTFHTARHSFGTYMATKIPLPQLLYLMQHSDIKTTMMYVNTSQELVKQGLLKVDWK